MSTFRFLSNCINRPKGALTVMVLAVIITFGLVYGFVSAEEEEETLSLVATHEALNYRPGGELDITISIEYTSYVSALGVNATLPEGWSFVSVASEDVPMIKPQSGAAGTLEFAWITAPGSPITFIYTVSVPEDEIGEKQITSEVLYRRLAGQTAEAVLPDPLVLTAE